MSGHEDSAHGASPSEHLQQGHHHSHHAHSHGHHHSHGHDDGQHSHTSGHQHGHSHQGRDQWVGEEYLKYPGLRELAKFSQTTVLYALKETGMTDKDIKALNLLEVGCGAGAVTHLYAESFGSVHAIDVSPSMLATFSDQLPADKYPNVSHSQHTLSTRSGGQFAPDEAVLSPTKAEPERKVKLARRQFDVAAVNLVLHHVDDIPGFMTGLKDLIVPGGFVVFTEFTNLNMGHRETKEGSVNAPDHFHHEFTEQSISALLGHFRFEGIYTEVRGKMAIWRDGKFHDVDCLIARGRKPAASG